MAFTARALRGCPEYIARRLTRPRERLFGTADPLLPSLVLSIRFNG
jgi:hypothetical protein